MERNSLKQVTFGITVESIVSHKWFRSDADVLNGDAYVKKRQNNTA